MKMLRHLLTLTIVAFLAVVATGQTPAPTDAKYGATAAASRKPLSALRHDIVTAIASMRSGLGIYSGHRDASIDAAAKAKVILDALIAAANPPTTPKAQAKDNTQKPADTKTPPPAKPSGKDSTTTAKDNTQKPADTKTPPPAKPTGKDPTTPAKPQTEAQPKQTVAGSQAAMRKGYEAIQQAMKDLKAAAGSIPDDKAAQIEKLLDTAAAEATKSISLHADQG